MSQFAMNRTFLGALLLASCSCAVAHGIQLFKAGAAKVDITLAPDIQSEITMNF
jgi:hypothetical protein